MSPPLSSSLASIKLANPGSPGKVAVKTERTRERERERERQTDRQTERQRERSPAPKQPLAVLKVEAEFKTM